MIIINISIKIKKTHLEEHVQRFIVIYTNTKEW